MRIDLQPNRSIYLNALHLMHNALDLNEIFQENAPDEFLENIFSKNEFSGTLAPDESASKKLSHLFFESKNLERIKGHKSLAVGFPLFVASDADDFVVAPLFLVKLELEQIQSRDENWAVKKGADHKIRFNPFLEKYFDQKFGEGYGLKLSELVEQPNFTFASIKKFVYEFAAKNHLEIPSIYKIFPTPNVEEFENISEQGNIKWSGVMGIFPPLMGTSFNLDQEVIASEFFNESVFDRTDKHDFGVMPMDPWQESAFQGTLKNQNFLVKGAKGSGKSQIVLNTILNGLSNGEKTLVISNRVSALNDLQSGLSKALDAPLHFLMKNEKMQRAQFLALLKASAQSNRKPTFDDSDWKYKINKTSREKNKLDKIYHAVNDPIFGQYNWTDVVGLFLKNNSVEGKEKLGSQLKVSDYQYEFGEYEALDFGVSSCQSPFGKIQDLNHPLNTFHESVFLDKEKEDALEHVKTQIGEFKDKATDLQKAFIQKTDEYKMALQSHYEQNYTLLSDKLESLQDYIEDSENKHGKHFTEGFFEWIGFKSYFSKKNKSIYNDRKLLAEKYDDLRLTYRQNKAFESVFEKEVDTREVTLIQERLQQLKTDLEAWRTTINGDVQEQMSKLTHRSVHPKMEDHQTQILKLEENLDSFILEMNDAQLFQDQFTNKMLTLNKKQQYLENIIEDLEKSEHNLSDFDPFFDWQSKWLALPKSGKKVVKALIKVKAEDWGAAFRSWYLFNFLNKIHSPELPNEEVGLKEFLDDYNEVHQLIPNQIQNVWAAKKQSAIAAIRSNHRALYQFFDGKNTAEFNNLSIGKSLKKSWKKVTDLIPVFFCTPEVAFSFLNHEQDSQIFDRVIFEEANLLGLTKSLNLAKLGKQRLIIGDLGPISSDIENSFLDWASAQQIEEIQLRKSYGQTIHNLTAFNTAAFTQVNEPQNEYISKLESGLNNFEINAVNGRFSESESFNEVEAQHILHLLNQVQQTPQRTYPSVGIGCFTHQQRDLIINYLSDIKSKNSAGVDTIKHLERNGLGVFDIANMSAEQFDIVIVSLTYGALNTNGDITEQIKHLNSDSGLKNIYSFATSPKQQMILVHSIPEKTLVEYQSDSSQGGFYRLGKFIEYGNLLSENKIEEASNLLDTMYKNDSNAERHIPESIFNAEVARILKPYFETGRIGLNLDWYKLVIPLYTTDNDGVLQTFLEADAFMSYAPNTNYVWEYNQREKVKEGKMSFIPIWSVDWWKNPEEEARKLAAQIIKMDKERKAKPKKESKGFLASLFGKK